MSHWLRAVRPKTAADEGWTDSEQAQDVLADIHERLNAAAATASSQSHPDRSGTVRARSLARLPRRVWLPAGALVAAAAVTVALTSGGASTPGSGNPPIGVQALPQLPAIRPVAMLLSKDSSCDSLLADLRAHTAAAVGPYGLPGRQYGAYATSAKAADLAQTPNAASAPIVGQGGTSTTNVQESGVDEPDLVKTDGGRVVTITDGVLRVVDATSRKVTGSLDLGMYQGAQGAQLLVAGDRALVILASDYGVMYDGGPLRASYGGGSASGSLSTYLYVDLSAQPKVTGSLRASGGYVDARMIGSTVRLVVSSAPVLNFPNSTADPAKSKAVNQAVIAKAPLSAWQPRYTVTTDAGSTTNTVPCEQISHPAKYTGASMLTVYTLDLPHLDADPLPVTVAADGDTVYATAASLYIASNPDWNSSAAKQQTEIHRFDIRGTTGPTYLGSGSIPGRLLSQYSLSDYAGHLRIATTTGEFGPTQSSSIYVLDSATLKITGHVDGLGKGEQLYAVRFLGPLAYVVTFRQTDPLYVVDLHSPTAPKVVGMLKITGYSTYLHDAGDGRLIGVGQEASPQGQVSGLQVSLFDVYTPATPTRTAQVVQKDAPGSGSLDPHAFLFWPETGLVVVPVQSWTAAQSGKVLVLRLNGAKLTTVGLLANPLATGTIDDRQGIQRSLIVDGALWTISGGGVQISNQTTLKRQAWVPFT